MTDTAEMQKQLDQAQHEMRNLQTSIRCAEQEAKDAKTALANHESEFTTLETQLADRDTQLSTLHTQVQTISMQNSDNTPAMSYRTAPKYLRSGNGLKHRAYVTL